jgi:predicted HAD superfamily Cof-like phosphohydrolase
MPTRNVNLSDQFDRLLEQREQEDPTKLEWLRTAAREGFDDIERGDFVTLRSGQEIDLFIDQLREEVSAKLATENTCA